MVEGSVMSTTTYDAMPACLIFLAENCLLHAQFSTGKAGQPASAWWLTVSCDHGMMLSLGAILQ